MSNPPLLSYRATSVDPDNLATVASRTELQVNRLAPSERPSTVRQAQSPDGWAFDLTELHSRLYASGGMLPDAMLVLFVYRGGDSTINGVPLETGVILTLPPGKSFDARIEPGLGYVGLSMPRERWEAIQFGATRDREDEAHRPGYVRLNPQRSVLLEGLAMRAAVRFHTQSEGTGALEFPADTFDQFASEIAIAAAADGGPARSPSSRSARRRLHQAHRARDFIRAHVQEPISIGRLCAEAGVSRRQLEYIFRQAFGVTPHDFIQLTRLNEIRRTLASAKGFGRTVTDVALDFGVTHLGRFSAAYRALFGESPRDTKRQAGRSSEQLAGRRPALVRQ